MLFSTFVTGASAGLNFLVQLAIVRWFGTATFGAFSFWRNNIYIAGSIGRFGLQGLALKQLAVLLEAQESSTIRNFYRFCLVLWFGTSTLVITIFWISGSISKSGDFIWPFIFTSFALAGLMIGVSILRVIGSLRLSILLDRLFVMTLFLSVIGYFIVQDDINATTLFLSFAASVICGFLLTIIAVVVAHRNNVRSLPDGNPKSNWGPWWRSGWSFFLLALGNILGQRSTLFISGLFLGTTELGRLAFMIMLAGLISLPLQALNQVASPNIARHAAKQEHSATIDIVRRVRLYSGAIGLIAIILIFFGSGLIEKLVGEAGITDSLILGILLLSAFVNACFGPVGQALSMTGHEKTAAGILNFAVAVKIVALVIAVPAFGLIGAAAVELGYTILWNFGMDRKLAKLFAQWKTGNV